LAAAVAILYIFVSRIERQYVCNFEPADKEKLPKPSPYMREVNAAAEKFGFRCGGWFVNKTKKRFIQAILTLWVSPDGLTLLHVISGKFLGPFPLKMTMLYSKPVGRSVLFTTDFTGMSYVSEFFDKEYICNGNLYELWERHKARMALWEGEFKKFDKLSALEGVEDVERRRAGVLIDTGYACWVNKEREVWRFTVKGAIKSYMKVRRELKEMNKQMDRVSLRQPGDALGGYETKGIWASLGRYSVMPPEKIIEDAAVDEGDVVLDFGCTDWRYTIAVAKAVGAEGKVYALEIYPKIFEKINERAKEEGLKNIETIQSDCITGLDDGSVDVVFLHEILHALRKEKHDMVLKELHRVLKAGGTLSFSEHDARKDEIISTITAGGLFKVDKKGENLYRFEKIPECGSLDG
jgi:ubiquinone/menaquinone biosynthesis C-methylase UbiE